MRLFEHVLQAAGLIIDLSGDELAGVHVEVDDGSIDLTVEIDGNRQTVNIPAGRSWSSGTDLRRGIGFVEMVPNPTATVTFDIGADAGTPGVGAEIGITTVKKGPLATFGNTLTTGGVAQQVIPINLARRYLFIQNRDAAETMFVRLFTGDAADSAHSIELPPGASFVMEGSFISTDKVTVLAATTGHVFACWEG